ncbi:ABC transporter permease [Glaciihabitans arcticus]|uniref:ABC transporter permease n=1 Tax=Glaciihabitans arcticus TaxID=2668039 RepID=A0A4Q9GXQ4_9MICO|nr:ABC transporter permease [Glaciihabitans arcticus]TBN57060.1 ABC transporter permease [Glaciihabitans arcticus]
MTVLVARRTRRPAAPGVVIASIFLGLLLFAALFPTLVTPIDPLRAQISDALQGPSAEHLFGTDQSGRDVFARVVHGARYSLAVGFGASLIALAAGLLIGLVSGLSPKPVDTVIGRIIVIGMAFPEFLVALLVIAIIGPGPSSLVIAIALAATPAYARIARSQTLVVSRASYVTAAVSLGVPRWRSVLRHVLPNTLGPLLVMATIGVGTAIVSAAGLSFLGLGPAAPTPEWGVILAEGRNLLDRAPWVALFPGLVITATVISTSVVGRRLRGGARAAR